MQRTFDTDALRVLDEATRTDVARICVEHQRHPAAVMRDLIRAGIAAHVMPAAVNATAVLDRLTAYLATNGWTPNALPHHDSAAAVLIWHHPTGEAAAVPARADVPGFDRLYRSCVTQVAAAEARPISALAADFAAVTGRR